MNFLLTKSNQIKNQHLFIYFIKIIELEVYSFILNPYLILLIYNYLHYIYLLKTSPNTQISPK